MTRIPQFLWKVGSRSILNYRYMNPATLPKSRIWIHIKCHGSHNSVEKSDPDQYQMTWIPKFFWKIGSGSILNYMDHATLKVGSGSISNATDPATLLETGGKGGSRCLSDHKCLQPNRFSVYLADGDTALDLPRGGGGGGVSLKKKLLGIKNCEKGAHGLEGSKLWVEWY